MKESIQTLSASFPDLDQSELCAKRIRERCPGVLSVKIRYHSLPQAQDPQPKAVMPSSAYLSALGQANAGYFGGQPPLMLFSRKTPPETAWLPPPKAGYRYVQPLLR